MTTKTKTFVECTSSTPTEEASQETGSNPTHIIIDVEEEENNDVVDLVEE